MLAANVNTLSLKRTTPHLASNAPAATTGPVIRFQAGRSGVGGEYAGTAAYSVGPTGTPAAGGGRSSSSPKRGWGRKATTTRFLIDVAANLGRAVETAPDPPRGENSEGPSAFCGV